MGNLRIILALPFALALLLLLTVMAIGLVIAFCAAHLFKAENVVYQIAGDVGAAGGAVVRWLLGRAK